MVDVLWPWWHCTASASVVTTASFRNKKPTITFLNTFIFFLGSVFYIDGRTKARCGFLLPDSDRRVMALDSPGNFGDLSPTQTQVECFDPPMREYIPPILPYTNPNPRSFGTKVHGGVLVSYTAEEMRERDRQQATKTYEDYKTHMKEVCERMSWCVQHGHWPADLNLDFAPGDDTKFMVWPWPLY